MAVGWANKGTFKTIRGELATFEDRAFERNVMPYLRLVFPELVNPPARRGFDVAGADHLVWSDTPPFSVVVQCKGFEVKDWEIGKAQADQCVRSIDAFRRSGLRADTYLLVHNRTGKSAEFRVATQAALASLERDGVVRRAELWDIDRLVKNALDALLERVRRIAHEGTLALAADYEREEPSLGEALTIVPVRTASILANQYRASIHPNAKESLTDPAKLLLDAETDFAVLIGYAGFGKTTATVRVAREPDFRTFFVPAARLTHLTTKDILKQCVNLEAVLNDCPSEDVPTVRRAAGLVIEYFFRMNDGTALLLLDGLDESVSLSQRGGLQMLFNALRGLQCRKVLTARKEFFEQRTADFATSFGLVSSREHRIQNQSITVVELLPWTDEQILELVRRVIRATRDVSVRSRLTMLADAIQSGDYASFYGDIPRRPLFLRFILDTVASGGVHMVTRAALFEEWARLKIGRDILAPARQGGQRAPIASETSVDDAIELAFDAMAWAARCMTRRSHSELELLASCRASDVMELPALRNAGSIEGLILNSLLVPVGPRAAPAPVEVRFAHRAYQEYFLARYVWQHRDAFAEVLLPVPIRDWLADFPVPTL